MRPSFVLSLLLLSTLIISEVQAIRLKKELLPVRDRKSQEGRTVNKGSNGAVDVEEIQCKEGKCSSGKNRKLIAKATSTYNPTTISKTETNGGKLSTDELGGKHESFSVDSSPDSSNHRKASQPTPQRYPDNLEIDEMDYSPARRKQPIHN